MKPISSYQKRLREIKYYKQWSNELREYCVVLAKELKKNGINVPFYAKGIKGDDFITGISEFSEYLQFMQGKD